MRVHLCQVIVWLCNHAMRFHGRPTLQLALAHQRVYSSSVVSAFSQTMEGREFKSHLETELFSEFSVDAISNMYY